MPPQIPCILGTNFLFAYAKDFSKKFSIFTGVGVSFLNGHVNDRSPLFKEDINARAVLGLKYTLIFSKKTIAE